MNSSYEFLFDIILDYSNSNITIPSDDISNNIVTGNLSDISGDASNTNFVDNLEESLVNILNSYMNPAPNENSLDSSGSRLSNFLQRRR